MKNANRKIIGNFGGRINWFQDSVNLACIEMAKQGVYARVIAARTGLTVNQVYTRCRQYGISTTDRRRGETPEVRKILDLYTPGKITASTFQQLKVEARKTKKFMAHVVRK